jgi:predicted enzyme related to lactoylglutathione lyase
MAMTTQTEATELSPSAPSSQNASSSEPPSHVPTRGLYGHITHTDLASSDPTATRDFCAKVFGWTFKPSFPTPAGDYHLYAYSATGGGGVRPINPPEVPGSVPFVHVEDAQAAFDAAVREGAEVMHPPERVIAGVTIAIIRAPGGVPIGLSGP